MIHRLRFALLYMCLLAPSQFAAQPPPANGLAEYRKDCAAFATATSVEQMHKILADQKHRIESHLRRLADSVSGSQKAPGITLEGKTFHMKVSAKQNHQFVSLLNSLDWVVSKLHPDTSLREEMIDTLLEKGINRDDLNILLAKGPEGEDQGIGWNLHAQKYMKEQGFGNLLNADSHRMAQLDEAELKKLLISMKAAGAYADRAVIVEIMYPLSTKARSILLEMTVINQGEQKHTIELTPDVTDAMVAEMRRRIKFEAAHGQTP